MSGMRVTLGRPRAFIGGNRFRVNGVMPPLTSVFLLLSLVSSVKDTRNQVTCLRKFLYRMAQTTDSKNQLIVTFYLKNWTTYSIHFASALIFQNFQIFMSTFSSRRTDLFPSNYLRISSDLFPFNYLRMLLCLTLPHLKSVSFSKFLIFHRNYDFYY